MEKKVTTNQLAVTIEQLAGSVNKLGEKFDQLIGRFDGLEGKFDGLEGRFDGLEGRFDGLEGRFDGLEGRFDGLEGKFDQLTEDIDERFDEFAMMTKASFDDQSERIEANTQAIKTLDNRIVVQGDWICGIQKIMDQEFAAIALGRQRFENRLSQHDRILTKIA